MIEIQELNRCCGARWLHNLWAFDANLNEVPHEDREAWRRRIKHAPNKLKTQVETYKYKILLAITNNFQPNAAKALQKVGFEGTKCKNGKDHLTLWIRQPDAD